jgi:glycosyltransferase involved in cell wall biosynthesis
LPQLKNRVAAGMILGDSFEDKELEQTFASLWDAGVTHVYVNYNGQAGMRKFTKRFGKIKTPGGGSDKGLKVDVLHIPWEDDFAKARQASFDMIPKQDFDWIMWIDSDDLLVVDEGTLDDMFESVDEYSVGIYVKYEYAIDAETGDVVVEQWRERFFRASVEGEWIYPVHEVFRMKDGSQLAKRNHCHIEHMRRKGDERGARERNRRIIAKALREDPEEPRNWFYFGSETLDAAEQAETQAERTELARAAIAAFDKYKFYVDRVGDDYYLATNRQAEAYRFMGEFVKALEIDLECIAIYPDWPDAYLGAARSCFAMEDWGRMKRFAQMALLCPKPDTPAGIESMNTTYTPLMFKGHAEQELGEYEQALVTLKQAREHWNPPDGSLDERIAKVEKILSEVQEDVEDVRKKLRGTRPEKSIAFFTNPLPFVWHPLADAGAGAERCIMQLVPRFAADGWRVVVFGTPGPHRGVHEGVEYWDSVDYRPAEPFTVFVSSRAARPFTTDINARAKLLWMHDVNIGQQMALVGDQADMILGLTKWHVAHLAKLYGIAGSKLRVVPNGIEMDRFPVDRSQDSTNAPRFIWSSSPDRGLDNVLNIWPEIKTRWPDARLDIYYGWDLIDKMIQQYRQAGSPHLWLEDFRARCMNQMEWLGREAGGIYEHGRVGQEELAKAAYEASFWPYMTSFMETFCITALEMQAAGVIPVASKLAALTETVAVQETLVEGWPMNRDYQVRWLKELDNVMTNEPQGEILRLNARSKGRALAESFTWDRAYSRWQELISELGVVA